MGRLLSWTIHAVTILGTGFIIWAIMGWAPLERHWLPDNVNKYGPIIDHLFNVVLGITAVIFVITGVVLGVSIGKSAANPTKPASYVHGSHVLELVWSIIPAGILLFITFYQMDAWAQHKMRYPTETVDGHQVAKKPHARLVARQFDWDVWYPGPDGELGTHDDLLNTDELYVPVDQEIVVQIESQDVLHSFFVPHMRLKQDVVPGMRQFVWFHPIKQGKYEIACTELCGWGHYKMRAHLHVVTPEKYAEFIDNLAAQKLTVPESE